MLQTRLTVVIIDSCPFFREGLRAWIDQHFRPLATYTQGPSEPIEHLHAACPQLVLIGACLREEESLALCRTLRAAWPWTKLALFEGPAASDQFQADAARCGANGVLAIDGSEAECIRQIAAVLSGQQSLSADISFDFTKCRPITDRQRAILRLLQSGYSDAKIAARLGLKTCTVRNHVQRILERLDVHSRQAAVCRARRLGWI